MSNANPLLFPPEYQIQLQSAQDRLDEYVIKMAPGRPISSADGAFQQRQLWQGVILQLLRLPAPVFLVGWRDFLKFVNQHRKGAFSPMYIHRFREETQLGINDRRNFERLLHLAYVTADASVRALSLKQLDMNQIMSLLPSEDMRQKFIEFYDL